jgi:hypothetical protein
VLDKIRRHTTIIDAEALYDQWVSELAADPTTRAHATEIARLRLAGVALEGRFREGSGRGCASSVGIRCGRFSTMPARYRCTTRPARPSACMPSAWSRISSTAEIGRGRKSLLGWNPRQRAMRASWRHFRAMPNSAFAPVLLLCLGRTGRADPIPSKPRAPWQAFTATFAPTPERLAGTWK